MSTYAADSPVLYGFDGSRRSVILVVLLHMGEHFWIILLKRHLGVAVWNSAKLERGFEAGRVADLKMQKMWETNTTTTQVTLLSLSKQFTNFHAAPAAAKIARRY